MVKSLPPRLRALRVASPTPYRGRCPWPDKAGSTAAPERVRCVHTPKAPNRRPAQPGPSSQVRRQQPLEIRFAFMATRGLILQLVVTDLADIEISRFGVAQIKAADAGGG